MSSSCPDRRPRALLACLAWVLLAAAPAVEHPLSPAPSPVLAVCADPSNLPYADAKLAGFENRVAALLAADLHRELRYTWNLQRRSFFRRTLLAGACDVVISVPAGFAPVATTRPWFTSGYVAVTRRADPHPPASLDDPILRTERIGLQLVGAEGANTPPAMSLARRGITGRITGYPMWAGDDAPDPQGRIVDAVASGQIDVALVWGPFAGYFARPYGAALRTTLLAGDPQLPALAFTYGMALGVRKTDLALRDTLQSALDRHQPEIATILRDYGVPLVSTPTP